jgi:HSP20 family protein
MTSVPTRPGGDGLTRWDPFAEMTQLNEALRRYLEAWDREFPADLDAGFTPLGDLEEAEEAYELEIELPGVERDEVDVELSGRRVRVMGERRDRERGGVVRRRTRGSGRFFYEVMLPGDVDPDRATASLHDGVLTIRLPKTESQRRRIAVT